MLDVKGISKLERLFRVTAQLDVAKTDLQRCTDFVNQKLYDLLLRGEAAATANGRDVIQPHDLPITKGLQDGDGRRILHRVHAGRRRSAVHVLMMSE